MKRLEFKEEVYCLFDMIMYDSLSVFFWFNLLFDVFFFIDVKKKVLFMWIREGFEKLEKKK